MLLKGIPSILQAPFWESGELSVEQIAYAAGDAFVAVEILEAIRWRCLEWGVCVCVCVCFSIFHGHLVTPGHQLFSRILRCRPQMSQPLLNVVGALSPSKSGLNH